MLESLSVSRRGEGNACTVAREAHRQRIAQISVLLALLGTAGCGGPGSFTCPQVVTVGGPVVQIAAVTSRQTGAAVGQFTLSNFARDGYAVSAASLVQGVPNTGATVSNGTLVCSGSCGFGQADGSYTFTISSMTTRDTTVTVAARYSTHVRTGCTYQEKDGTVVSFSL